MRMQVSDVLTQLVAMHGVRFQIMGSLVEGLVLPLKFLRDPQ